MVCRLFDDKYKCISTLYMIDKCVYLINLYKVKKTYDKKYTGIPYRDRLKTKQGNYYNLGRQRGEGWEGGRNPPEFAVDKLGAVEPPPPPYFERIFLKIDHICHYIQVISICTL